MASHNRKVERGDYDWGGMFPVPFSRAKMSTSDNSASIGAGDVGNPYESSDDSTQSGGLDGMPCPGKK